MALSKRKRAAIRAIAEPHQHELLALAMAHVGKLQPLLERIEAGLARLLPKWAEEDTEGVRRWKPHAYGDALAFFEMVARQVDKRLAAELDTAIAEAKRLAAEHVDADLEAMTALFKRRRR